MDVTDELGNDILVKKIIFGLGKVLGNILEMLW